MSDFSVWLILVYILSIIAVMLVRYISAPLGGFIAVCSSIVAFIMAALRPENFPDFVTYVAMFDHAATGDFENPNYWSPHGEPGFKLIAYAISEIGFESIGLMIFMSGLSFILLTITSRIANIRFAYLWFTYFSLYFITRDLGVMRLGIASHLIVIALLQKNFYSRLAFLAFTSFVFQYYAIITIAGTFLSKIKPNIKILIILIILSLLFGSLIRFDGLIFFASKKLIENYQGSDYLNPGYMEIIFPFIRNIFYSIILYWYLRKKLNIQEYRSWIWLAFVSSFCYLAFSGVLVLAHRFSAYFGAIFPLAFAFILNQPDSRNRHFLFIALIMIISFIFGLYFTNWVWML